ncbi:MAG: guanylate kinase [Candidatus Omnitrophica bacterium]|nr:guanylate kinase [Candidatus Omnitrophota bacterium]
MSSAPGRRTGLLFVLSAPSGSGKTTLMARLQRWDRRLVRSVSMTTRGPRSGERHGREYWFVTPSRFAAERRRGALLEHAQVLQHWYGTPRGGIEAARRRGRDVLLGIDVQGARQIKRSGYPAVSVFIQPPGVLALRRRLQGRGTETPAQIRARLALARRELRCVPEYDYVVVNDRLDDAVAQLEAIIMAERCRVRPAWL